MKAINIGQNSLVAESAVLGENITIGSNCIIEGECVISDDCYIDSNTIIRSGVKLGKKSTIGANCIIGEYQMDFYRNRESHVHELLIGENAIIRSGTIIYSGSQIGDNLQTGHHVTIREKSQIGKNVSIGTLSDIQGHCRIGDYVRMHSNVHIGQSSQIDDCCWIFPYVVLTNDPTPPSETEMGVHVHSFAIIATHSVVLPGIDIQSDSLIGAGSVVNRDVEKYQVVVGNPGRVKGDIRNIKNRETGENYYPWRYRFDRAMPWEGYGFDQWYNMLGEDVKKLFQG